MTPEFMHVFEDLWISFRALWCEQHDLAGALAFSRKEVKNEFFHRVVRVQASSDRVPALIEDCLALYRGQGFDCHITLSPRDLPVDFGEHLVHAGFRCGHTSAAMRHEAEETDSTTSPGVTLSTGGDYDCWAGVMCRSFGFDPAMGEVGRSVSVRPQVRRYLARVDGVPAGIALLFSQADLGYVDFVGTLPEFRCRGVASSLVRRAVADSRQLGNRWTALESVTGGDTERLYQKLGFRSAYLRNRYMRSL